MLDCSGILAGKQLRGRSCLSGDASDDRSASGSIDLEEVGQVQEGQQMEFFNIRGAFLHSGRAGLRLRFKILGWYISTDLSLFCHSTVMPLSTTPEQAWYLLGLVSTGYMF